jgi:hypothetical protein
MDHKHIMINIHSLSKVKGKLILVDVIKAYVGEQKYGYPHSQPRH